MIKLTDTHAILLSTASQRDNGSVLPLPDTIKASGGTSKALAGAVSLTRTALHMMHLGL
ncbi:hypothetical protein [Sphingomonas rubra]|uniref:Uncharacterized protein n=1 Tax=Sphingomonas rubra TaxID=634430 RepID=A0A1I5UNE7_9SPHN|nr:hypothetical protein [Sphingomonas rubra]SFP96740.1 hypothetical protein SAMN04488241_11323 [Sphingomonas rubra]